MRAFFIHGSLWGFGVFLSQECCVKKGKVFVLKIAEEASITFGQSSKNLCIISDIA